MEFVCRGSRNARTRVQSFEIAARSVLNRTKPGMPFTWSINPYRGCEFGCKYCYARYTHEFMGMEDARQFEDRIYAKGDVAAILRRELRKTDRREGIAIGTATDPYQPADASDGRDPCCKCSRKTMGGIFRSRRSRI